MEMQESKSGSSLVISFQGRLDGANSQAAQERMNAALDRGETSVLVNMSKLDYVSSAGLRVFMSAGKRLRASSGTLAFCELQDFARELFEIAGFTSLFPVYNTQGEALQSLGK